MQCGFTATCFPTNNSQLVAIFSRKACSQGQREISRNLSFNSLDGSGQGWKKFQCDLDGFYRRSWWILKPSSHDKAILPLTSVIALFVCRTSKRRLKTGTIWRHHRVSHDRKPPTPSPFAPWSHIAIADTSVQMALPDFQCPTSLACRPF